MAKKKKKRIKRKLRKRTKGVKRLKRTKKRTKRARRSRKAKRQRKRIKKTKRLKKRRKAKRRKLKSRKPKPKKEKRPKIKKEPMASLLLPLHKVKDVFRTRYGFFLYDGSEYVITAPESPAPWSNIITNDNYGFIVTQTGGGFSFKKSIADKTTVWKGDINTDKDGKFFYIRDNKTQQFWSATWNPVQKNPQFYEVRYGVGYTNITNQYSDIITSVICFTAKEEPVEIWQLRLNNISDQPRSLSVFSYLQWYFSSDKEKAFLRTSFDKDLCCIFTHSADGEIKFHSVSKQVTSFTTDRKAFLGIYRDAACPRSVEKGMCFKEEGRYVDPAACLHVDLDLEAKGEAEIIFVIGTAADIKVAQNLVKKYKHAKEVENEFSNMGSRWSAYLRKPLHIKTPDEGANILNNNWFRYQAISAGLSAKGCYYDTEGAAKFKDFILNSLTFLPIDAEISRRNILESAKRQFQDGPDEPLWLVYAVSQYLKETANLSVLKEKIPYQDAQSDTLFNHCLKAIEKTLSTISNKGVPASGRQGYSVWLGEFLYYTINEFSFICNMIKEEKTGQALIKRASQVKEGVNRLFKNCEWYPSAITTKGEAIGKSGKKDSVIYLNPQTWAVIAKLTEGENAKKLMDTVAKHLYQNHGPIALSPSYKSYDPDVGALTNLPPGVEDNGGTNIESACWAAWAETMLDRAHNAWDIYSRLNPVHRAHRADIYEMEPFVASCYIDGPDSSKFGQARISWYGTSAYWLNKILIEHILGIKPTYNGLLIAPCIPKRWKLFKVYRTFRGTRYVIDVINYRHVSSGVAEVVVDGKKVKTNLLPVFNDEKSHYVRVTMGKYA